MEDQKNPGFWIWKHLIPVKWGLVTSIAGMRIRTMKKVEGSNVLLLTFKALKWNVFTITACKDVIFMHRFRQSVTNRCKSISVYLSIVTENRYQSITTRIFANDWSSIISINQLIDIDWYFINWVLWWGPDFQCSLPLFILYSTEVNKYMFTEKIPL